MSWCFPPRRGGRTPTYTTPAGARRLWRRGVGRRRAEFDARAMSPRGDSAAPPALLATLPPTSA